jgi:hypothetical protein
MLHTCKSAILSASGSTTDARAIKQQSAAMAMNASGIRDTARAARQSHHRDSFLGAACLSWQGKERLTLLANSKRFYFNSLVGTHRRKAP